MTDRDERFAELENLEPGWLNGSGEAIDPSAVANARRIIALLKEDPAIFPMPNGGIQLAWGGTEIELDIFPDGSVNAWLLDMYLTEAPEDE